jgi:DNA modification methylase
MNTLEPRTYPVDTDLRHLLFTPDSINHPAKMQVHLLVDLFLRYTRVGQYILDPMGGIGTSFVGSLLGRHVWVQELESRFYRMAVDNSVRVPHVRPLAQAALAQANPILTRWYLEGTWPATGHVRATLGDSRRLTVPDDLLAGGITSPPYESTLPVVNGPPPDSFGDAISSSKREYYDYGTTPGQIGILKRSGVVQLDGGITSPPYGDLAKRDRTKEAYQEKAKEKFGTKYGHGSASRHVDGYGDHSPGQIGDLPTRAPADQETYESAMQQVYAEMLRVIRPGGVLVLVTGNYLRDGEVIDIAADTIAIAQSVGWTPLERWQHAKSKISLWRYIHHKQRPDTPVITGEDVLVFSKGDPGWRFFDLPPTQFRPARLEIREKAPELPLFDD